MSQTHALIDFILKYIEGRAKLVERHLKHFEIFGNTRRFKIDACVDEQPTTNQPDCALDAMGKTCERGEIVSRKRFAGRQQIVTVRIA